LFSFSAETRLLRILAVTPEKVLALLLLLLLALLMLLLASARLLLPAPLLLLETPKLALALALSARVSCRALGPLAVAPVPPASLGTLSSLRSPFLLSSVTLGSLVVSGRLAAFIGPRPRLLLLVAALPATACPRARARACRAAPRPLVAAHRIREHRLVRLAQRHKLLLCPRLLGVALVLVGVQLQAALPVRPLQVCRRRVGRDPQALMRPELRIATTE
jgi:hypothetical protein